MRVVQSIETCPGLGQYGHMYYPQLPPPTHGLRHTRYRRDATRRDFTRFRAPFIPFRRALGLRLAHPTGCATHATDATVTSRASSHPADALQAFASPNELKAKLGADAHPAEKREAEAPPQASLTYLNLRGDSLTSLTAWFGGMTRSLPCFTVSTLSTLSTLLTLSTLSTLSTVSTLSTLSTASPS